MKILVYDTECNSLDLIGGYVMELAWAIYDSETWRCLKSTSALIKWGRPYPVEKGASDVTGLSLDFCETNGTAANLIFYEFINDVDDSQYLCGHNAVSFDKPMICTNLSRASLHPGSAGYGTFQLAPHIDTLLDIPYPETQKIMSLKYLALDHGYVMSNAHEAMADVFACAHILKQYDFEKVLEISKTPLVTITTKIPWEDGAGRARVKNARFYWNPTKKHWEKKMREYYMTNVQLQLGSDIQLEITNG